MLTYIDRPQSEIFNTRYLPQRAFADAINSSVRVVELKVAAGKLPAVRDGGRIKIKVSPAEYLSALPDACPVVAE